MSATQAASAPDLGGILHTRRLLEAGDRGQDVRVGVISDGATNYPALSRRGALPSNVAFFGEGPGHGDEGDWMLQVVHQIAPQAQLAFCPGGPPAQTVACARQLVTAFHADIVVDDINPQPVYFFQTPKDTGFAEIADKHPGVLFFTGAGNNGGGYYEGPWTPTPLSVAGRQYLAQDFGRSEGSGPDPYDAFVLPSGAQAQVLLGTSADPNGGPAQCAPSNPEITLALLDEQGAVLDSIEGNCPFLQLRYANGGSAPLRMRVAVLLSASSRPAGFALKLVAIRAGDGVSPLVLRYRTEGSAGNSALAPGLVAVAAVDPATGWHGRYLVETFANSGPQCQDYAAVGPDRWMRLHSRRCVRQPAFVTPDRAVIAMPGPGGLRMAPFVGDSSAGPAAAGVAALLLSAHVPGQRIVDLLERTATPQVDAAGWNARYGYGLIDAAAAAAAVRVLPAEQADDPPPRPVPFIPTPAFLQDRALSMQAAKGDPQALAELRIWALAGRADAQTWLAMAMHGTGDDASAARWARAAAEQGQPVAQGFLGTLYNRGWGVAMDPRAAQVWWWRAARCGVPSAMYNLGTTAAAGRGTPADPAIGYALMRAAQLRGMRFPPMAAVIADARARLGPGQLRTAEAQASRFAAEPSTIPEP